MFQTLVLFSLFVTVNMLRFEEHEVVFTSIIIINALVFFTLLSGSSCLINNI